MTKLVLKTILKTLLCVVILGALIYGVLALFFPSTLASGFNMLGNYNLSVKYYQKTYEKSGDYDDLVVLCDRVDEEKDSARAEKYLKILTGDKNFEVYFETFDQLQNTQIVFTSIDFYTGKHVLATYNAQGLDKALSLASDYVDRYGYNKFSPYGFLISSYLDKMSDGDKQKIKTELSAILASDIPEEQKANVTIDLGLLN